jgi:hypothetical protein
MATRVEVQHQFRPLKVSLDLVLNVMGAYDDTAEVAGHAATLTTPHAKWGSLAQGSHAQPSRSWLPRGRFSSAGADPFIRFRLVPLVRKRYVALRLCAEGCRLGKRM